jgi:hypothetical protein
MDICWKIGFVVVFRLPDVFVEFAFDERIKTHHGCCFIYLQPLFATIFAISLEKTN